MLMKHMTISKIEKEDIIDKMSLINFTDVSYNMITHNSLF